MQSSNIQLEETTAKLQEEKLRLDALLVRQYNLLAVLGGRSGGDSKGNSKEPGSGSDNSIGGSKEALTLGDQSSSALTSQPPVPAQSSAFVMFTHSRRAGKVLLAGAATVLHGVMNPA